MFPRRTRAYLRRYAVAALAVITATCVQAQTSSTSAVTSGVDARVVEWRRDFHRNPELSNREVRTAKIVAEHLRKLGLPVETGIAKTGVVALLKGGKPGPTIALRADMDALPVTEKTDVPFRSQVVTEYRGEQVGVMHACGHDMHTAVLMGVAEILVRERAKLSGNVLFVFQPAEEGAPEGEEGGAPLMLKEGLFEKYKPEAAFAFHTSTTLRTGEVGYRSGPLRAASDAYRIVVTGRQTHGARPWQGVDPIVTSAQIVTALQTIVSRETDLTAHPAVVSVGYIKGGIRTNILPESVEMGGTIRTFDKAQRAQILSSMERILTNVAEAQGATATFELAKDGNPVTVNDADVTARVLPSLERAVGKDKVRRVPLVTGSEDFAYFAEAVPSFYYFVGVTPVDQDPATAPTTHSNLFYVDERSLPVATAALAQIALDYLATP